MKTLIYLFFLAAMIACNSKTGPAIDLKLNLQKGDSFTLVTQAVTSQNTAISVTQFTETKYVVDAVTADAYKLKAYLVRTKTEITQDGKTDGYDSEKDEASMTPQEMEIHNQYKQALTHAMNVTMGKNDMINGSATYDDGGTVPSDILDSKNITLNYPATPVKVGDEWQKEMTDEFTKIKVTNKYTLKAFTDKDATIGVKMSMKGAGGMLDNDGDGEYTIDRKTGEIIKGNIDLNMQSNGSLRISVSQK